MLCFLDSPPCELDIICDLNIDEKSPRSIGLFKLSPCSAGLGSEPKYDVGPYAVGPPPPVG